MPITKRQVIARMRKHNIPGEVSGRGQAWQVELPDESAMDRFREHVASVGGYRCGWGGWVLRPGYQVDNVDFNNPASRHHY